MPKKIMAHLFEDNPPENLTLVRKLFVNRENDIRFCLDFFQAGETFPKVLAVHGKTRCGKSHLVRYLLSEVQDKQLPYQVFIVNANARGDAEAVLDDLFYSLEQAISGLDPDQVPDGVHEPYEAAIPFLRSMKELILGEKHSVDLARTREALSSDSFSMKLAPPPFELSGANTVSLKEGVEERWTRKRPLLHEMVELIRYEADLLAHLHKGSRVVLLVDDLDLLDRPKGSGKQQANLLLDYLKPLAEPETITLLATTRPEYYNERSKDLKNFRAVRVMDGAAIRSVYERHIELFNAGDPVFDDAALEWLDKIAEGRVGIFLQRCYQIWSHFYGQETPALLGLKEVKEYIAVELDELRSEPRHAEFFLKIEETVRAGKLDLVFKGDLDESGVLYGLLSPTPGRPDAFTLNHVYAQVLKERLSINEKQTL